MKGKQMLIKMIRDNGSYKKDTIYEVEDKKATELLTAGYCVRAKEKKTNTKKQGKTNEPK